MTHPRIDIWLYQICVLKGSVQHTACSQLLVTYLRQFWLSNLDKDTFQKYRGAGIADQVHQTIDLLVFCFVVAELSSHGPTKSPELHDIFGATGWKVALNIEVEHGGGTS